MLKNAVVARLLLLVGIVAGTATASAITYDINFTDGSPLPTSGSFNYDATTATFSAFTISWDGQTFDLTFSANAPGIGGDPCGGLTGAAATFGFLTDPTGQCGVLVYGVNWYEYAPTSGSESFGFEGATIPEPVPANWIGISATNLSVSPAGTSGGWTTSVAAPEPSTAAMALIAGAFLARRFLARRKIGRIFGSA